MRKANHEIKGIIAIVLSFGLLLGTRVPLQATAPISGDTHSFGGSGNVQNTSNAVLTLTLADLDNDSYADVAYGDGSDLKIVENDGSPFDGWPTADTAGTAGNTISGVAAADFDLDGRLDLVSVTQGGGNEVKLWQNPSDPFINPWTTSNTLTSALAFNVTCVATGDLDNDGAVDVAVAGDNGTILVWRNPLTPFTTSWGSPLTVGTGGAGIEDLVLADLDGDGALDIITGSQNEDYELVAWENDGTPFNGSWPQHDIGATSNDRDIRALAAGDLDNDGDVDIATGLVGSPWLVVWQNDGSPFTGDWIPTDVDSSNPTAAVSDVVLADLDLDGDLDLAGVYGASVRSWQNDGSPFSGSWALQPAIGTAGNVVNVLTAGDLDNDGDIDLISGSDSASYEILAWENTLIHRNIPNTPSYKGTSVGSFSSNVGEVAMADLDKDGDLDMISGNAAGTLTIWQNNGAPFSSAWSAHLLGTTYEISALAVGDVDDDGDLDIVAGETGSAPRLRIWRNDGTPFDGGWVSSTVSSSYAKPVAAIALGDLDNDGDLDIVSGSGQHLQCCEGEIIAWRNDGNNNWSPNTVYVLTYTIGGNTYATAVNALALGDLDNDGDLDIVAGTDHAMSMGTIDNPVDSSLWPNIYELHTYENDSTPFSGVWPQTNVGRDKEEITLGDLSRYHGFWGATVFSVDLADFDLDGDLDIVSGEHVEADYQVKVWRNDGTPFSGESEWDSAAAAIDAPWLDTSVWSVKAVDYDLDGDPDIVSGSGEPAKQVVTWENNGQPFQHLIPDGTTWAQTTWIRHNVGSCDPMDRNVLSIAVGDLDNDGDPDVGGAVGCFYDPQSPYGVNVWRNRGGSVTEAVDPAVSPTDTLNLTEDNSYELLAVTVTHNGVADDNDIELKEWNLLFEETTGDPLTSIEADALIDTLWIYRESNGIGGWQSADSVVLTINSPSLTNGVQTISFTDGDSGVQVAPTASANFYAVARIASEAGGANPRTFQITFDPDADSIVEDRTEDTSVSIQDSEPTTAGTFVAFGPPHHVSIEYAADGTGSKVLTTTLLSGDSIVSYSIVRDRHENFLSNDTAYWSLTDRTGGVAETDLYPYWYQGQSKVATFTGHLPGAAKIRALIQLAQGNIDGTSGTLFVVGRPYTVTLEANPTSIAANGTSTSTITATITDQWSNLVADGTVVTFTASLGSFPMTPYTRTTTSGVAVATLTAGIEAGTAMVTATAMDAVGNTAVQFVPGGAYTLTLEANPASITVGGQTSIITATVRDEHDNLVADGAMVTFTTSLGSFPATPYTALTSSGVATATLTSGNTSGQATVTANTGTAQNQTMVQFTPGQLASFGLGVPASGTAGQPFTMTITARDQFGNTITDFAEDVSLSTTNGGTISPTVAKGTDFVAGVWTGPITLSEAGEDRVIVVASGEVSSQATIDLAQAEEPPNRVFLPVILRNH